jgi:alkylation response protein AidB-like acyl-CoA dehydrogenase
MFFKPRYVPIDADSSARQADGLIHWFRDFAARRLNSRLMDDRRAFSPQLVLELGNHGAFAMSAPCEYGGLGLRFRDWVRVLVQMGGVDVSIANFVILCTGPGLRALSSFARPRVRAEFLPGLIAGRMLGAFAQTEPGAGTNFQAITTTATPAGGGRYRISGEKLYIGNAGWSSVMTVMAYLKRPDGQLGGLTTFAVPTDRRGVVVDHEITTLGLRGFVQNRVRFDEVEIDEDMIVGEPEKGLEVGVDNMCFSRISIAASAIGGMKRCAQLAHRFASRRPVAGGLLLASPVTLSYLTEVTAMAAVCEALLLTITDSLDEGQDVPIEAPVAAKVSASESLFVASDGLVQILGGRGYDEANIAPQISRDARIMRIFEGATEPLILFLGQRAHQRTSGIYDFLGITTNSPSLSEELREVVAQLSQRSWPGAGPLATTNTAQEWRFYLAGKAALWAMLTAAAQHRLPQTEPPQFRTAIRWARLRFDEAKRLATAGGTRDETMLGVDDISQVVLAYGDAIGDIEQTLAGENHQLDPWLRKEYVLPHAVDSARPQS